MNAVESYKREYDDEPLIPHLESGSGSKLRGESSKIVIKTLAQLKEVLAPLLNGKRRLPPSMIDPVIANIHVEDPSILPGGLSGLQQVLNGEQDIEKLEQSSAVQAYKTEIGDEVSLSPSSRSDRASCPAREARPLPPPSSSIRSTIAIPLNLIPSLDSDSSPQRPHSSRARESPSRNRAERPPSKSGKRKRQTRKENCKRKSSVKTETSTSIRQKGRASVKREPVPKQGLLSHSKPKGKLNGSKPPSLFQIHQGAKAVRDKLKKRKTK